MGWDDDSKDQRVNNRVRLIRDGHVFKKVMFVACHTTNGLARIRNKKKHKEKEAREKKERDACSEPFDMEVQMILSNKYCTINKMLLASNIYI